MGKQLIDKYNLNLAGEYRVAAELLLRGLYTSVTFGNKKGADLYAIGENRRAAVVEVKASQTGRFVTGLYQKYRTGDAPSPDFWVLYLVRPSIASFEEKFFVLTHKEITDIQGQVNCPGEVLTHEQIAEKSKGGVDNVSVKKVEKYEGEWRKILEFCNREEFL
ncbi:hypothetical protein SH501x_001586 [Pirellulaceae bacterium SH501]